MISEKSSNSSEHEKLIYIFLCCSITDLFVSLACTQTANIHRDLEVCESADDEMFALRKNISRVSALCATHAGENSVCLNWIKKSLNSIRRSQQHHSFSFSRWHRESFSAHMAAFHHCKSSSLFFINTFCNRRNTSLRNA